MADYASAMNVDWSPVANLGKIYQQAQMRQAYQGADLSNPQGLQALALRALQSGDQQTGLTLANLADQRMRDQRDFSTRREDVAFNQGIQRRQTDLAERQAQEKPQYMKDESGNIVEIKPYGAGARVITPAGAVPGTNPYAAPGKAPQEHEAKAGIFATRMAQAHRDLSKFEDINTGTGVISGVIANTLPEGATTLATSVGALGGTARNQVMNAQRQFINALLRRESGAAIASSEFASYSKEYFPQPGDSPEVIARKREARQNVIEGLMTEAGKTYTPPKDFIGSRPSPSVAPAPNAQPQVAPAPNAWRTKEAITAARNDPQGTIAQARAAIERGMPREEAIARLRAAGVDPSGL